MPFPVRAFGGQYVPALERLEDAQQTGFALEVVVMINQDLADGIRAEEVNDAAEQDVEFSHLTALMLKSGGCCQGIGLDFLEQWKAEIRCFDDALLA